MESAMRNDVPMEYRFEEVERIQQGLDEVAEIARGISLSLDDVVGSLDDALRPAPQSLAMALSKKIHRRWHYELATQARTLRSGGAPEIRLVTAGRRPRAPMVYATCPSMPGVSFSIEARQPPYRLMLITKVSGSPRHRLDMERRLVSISRGRRGGRCHACVWSGLRVRDFGTVRRAMRRWFSFRFELD